MSLIDIYLIFVKEITMTQNNNNVAKDNLSSVESYMNKNTPSSPTVQNNASVKNTPSSPAVQNNASVKNGSKPTTEKKNSAVTKQNAKNTNTAKSSVKKAKVPVLMPIPEYLIAPKSSYQLWYDAYNQAKLSKDKKIHQAFKKHKKFYKEWKSDESSFEAWWKEKAYLFEDKSKVEEVSKYTKSKTSVNLSIPVNKSMDTLVNQFKNVMKPILDKTKTQEVIIKHKFAPTINKGLKPINIKLLLELNKTVFNQKFEDKQELAYQVSMIVNKPEYKDTAPASLVKFKELYENMQKSNPLIKAIVKSVDIKEMSNVKRYINRYRQKGHKLLMNVAMGIFPGKY